MNSKLSELITPPSKKDPWLQALESQARNITLSDGTVLGVVSSKNLNNMDDWDVYSRFYDCIRRRDGHEFGELIAKPTPISTGVNLLGSDLISSY